MKQVLNITKGLTAEILIIDGMVFVNTNYNGNKRSMSFETIEIAINQTTMPMVANYLKSI
jgi:hypothetical protein